MHIQGHPQRMRLQGRLYGIYTVRFLIFMIPCNSKLVSIFVKTFKKPLKDYIQLFKAEDILQSHSLRVNPIICFLYFINRIWLKVISQLADFLFFPRCSIVFASNCFSNKVLKKKFQVFLFSFYSLK